MNIQSIPTHAVLAQEFEETTGQPWAEGGQIALRIGDNLDLSVEIDPDTSRLLVSASVEREELLLSADQLRLISTACTSAMAEIGVAIGLHPIFERAVVAWSAALDDVRPGMLAERMGTVIASALELEQQLTQLREAPIEPLPAGASPADSHLLRA